MPGAYRVLGHISLGLSDGRRLNLRPAEGVNRRRGDLIPPSWAAENQYQVDELLSTGVACRTTTASAAEIAQAEAAAEAA